MAGKTGTTNDEKDAWFIGYTPDLVVGVFIGYDTPRPMGKGMTGGHVAAPIFAQLHEDWRWPTRRRCRSAFRPGIKLVRVSLRTGLRVQGGETDTVLEAFKPNEEPDDAYSVIGFTNESGSFINPRRPAEQPRSLNQRPQRVLSRA